MKKPGRAKVAQVAAMLADRSAWGATDAEAASARSEAARLLSLSQGERTAVQREHSRLNLRKAQEAGTWGRPRRRPTCADCQVDDRRTLRRWRSSKTPSLLLCAGCGEKRGLAWREGELAYSSKTGVAPARRKARPSP